MSTEPKKIGLIAATALVIGNMIGAGIFVLPATLASYGSISILGWIFSAAGAFVLAKICSGQILSQVLYDRSRKKYAAN